MFEHELYRVYTDHRQTNNLNVQFVVEIEIDQT